MKVVEQAVRDYVNLQRSKICSEKAAFETARAFLFDEGYVIDWGGDELEVQRIFDMLDLDIDWLRRKTLDKNVQRLRERAEDKRAKPPASQNGNILLEFMREDSE